jgi:hypothetical protein
VKASPAAVPSTASTLGGVARATSRPSSSKTAPSSPSVTTRSFCGPIISASYWFATTRSGSTASGRAGAALTQSQSAWMRASRIASSGISSWQRTSPPVEKPPTVAFAPGTTTMAFSPSSATRMIAIPVGASTSRTSSSTPAARKPASASPAFASAPTAPVMRTLAPSRAAATAWFAPLPPGNRSSVAPLSVSPGLGSRSTFATRSRLIDPTTLSRVLGGKCAQVDRGAFEVLAQVEETGPE